MHLQKVISHGHSLSRKGRKLGRKTQWLEGGKATQIMSHKLSVCGTGSIWFLWKVPRYLIKVGSPSFLSRRGVHFLIHALRALLTLLAVLCPSPFFRALQHQFGFLNNVETLGCTFWKHEKQCCGSGSGRIRNFLAGRIRMISKVRYPDPKKIFRIHKFYKINFWRFYCFVNFILRSVQIKSWLRHFFWKL